MAQSGVQGWCAQGCTEEALVCFAEPEAAHCQGEGDTEGQEETESQRQPQVDVWRDVRRRRPEEECGSCAKDEDEQDCIEEIQGDRHRQAQKEKGTGDPLAKEKEQAGQARTAPGCTCQSGRQKARETHTGSGQSVVSRPPRLCVPPSGVPPSRWDGACFRR